MHADCADGCLSSYWRRPELYLEAEVRAAIYTFHWIPDDARKAGLQRLEADLASGA